MIKTTGLTGGFDYEHVKEPVYSRSYGKEDTREGRYGERNPGGVSFTSNKKKI